MNQKQAGAIAARDIRARIDALFESQQLILRRIEVLESKSSMDIREIRSSLEEMQQQLAANAIPCLESTIISDFPSIFDEFRGSGFELLYRGSRDGFSADQFYAKCRGQRNTLTIIKTHEGWVFGGYTPVAWEVPKRQPGFSVKDPSLRSFLFTLNNPQRTQPMKFPLKADPAANALLASPFFGPSFGGIGAGNCDIRLSDKCNCNSTSYTALGSSYANTTGCDGSTFLAGARNFTVSDVEVFMIVQNA
jgi:hypothetical protein